MSEPKEKRPRDPIERVLSKVAKTNGCWIYKGRIDVHGYAVFRANKKKHRVHRYLYEHFVRTLNKYELCCHICDVKSCINPDHIFIGTNKDNYDDLKNKGKHVYGSRHGMAKLTAKDARKIREKYIPRKYSIRRLAKDYGVTSNAIASILYGLTWKESV